MQEAPIPFQVVVTNSNTINSTLFSRLLRVPLLFLFIMPRIFVLARRRNLLLFGEGHLIYLLKVLPPATGWKDYHRLWTKIIDSRQA